MPCYALEGVVAVVDPSAYVHPTAVLIGDVIVGPTCYAGPNARLRGDFGRIVLKDGANVQDTCVIHGFAHQDTVVEENGHIGHGAVLHSCTFVPAGVKIPPRSLVAGMPAKVRRELRDGEIAWKREGTRTYQDLTKRCVRSMRETAPLRQIEANRPRLEAPDVQSLIATRRGEGGEGGAD